MKMGVAKILEATSRGRASLERKKGFEQNVREVPIGDEFGKMQQREFL